MCHFLWFEKRKLEQNSLIFGKDENANTIFSNFIF